MDVYTATEVAYWNGFEAGKESVSRWISVEDKLPEVEKKVIVSVLRHSDFTNKDYRITICAIYEDGSVNVEDSCWMCEDGEYNKEKDIVCVPQGWYEYHEYGNIEEDGIALICDDNYCHDVVTHWMERPKLFEVENNGN